MTVPAFKTRHDHTRKPVTTRRVQSRWRTSARRDRMTLPKKEVTSRMSADPVVAARMLNGLLAEGLRQDTLIFYLKRAVPGIPLSVLLDAQAWREVGPGPLTDEDVDEMLRPWWPSRTVIEG
ncbi:hypothetical protein COUCH_28090 [Couchioplanes caeruleus]|uniref:hypothetical protein n=1 Tax=Couchioplanes caeruleus TaxID=56438 RepID=UPI0020C11522|nr:hypothetical protein [Couchioplanes caeruleus]UQU62874.1 hypothetical protein COUCH_28090 [Couchioplanes caeruleus]